MAIPFPPVLKPGSKTALWGPNFSGRTEFLRSFTGLGAGANGCESGHCAYIGPDVYNYISGLASTVGEELSLHSRSAGALRSATALLEELSLARLLARNPFTLSGGEQALVAIAAATSLQPHRLSLDCTLEQLDTQFRHSVIRHLSTATPQAAVAIADNRLEEYRHNWDILPLDSAPHGGLSSLVLNVLEAPQVPEAQGLEVEGLAFAYPSGPPVLSDVCLQLAPGAVYCLRGASGTGKSTLARLLAGVLRPSRGTIRAAGRPVTPWRKPGKLVGYHFQAADTQLFAMTVHDELRLSTGKAARGLFSPDYLAQVFGLGAVLGEHPLDLPWVVRKRVALAATFAMPVPWLVLDEPTLGQDDASLKAIAGLINQACDSGAGCIVITHSTTLPEFLARPQILQMEHGRVHAASGPCVD